jgi:hypothetical protein
MGALVSQAAAVLTLVTIAVVVAVTYRDQYR